MSKITALANGESGSSCRTKINTALKDLNGETIDEVQLNAAQANPAHSEGLMFYDQTKKAMSYYNEEADVTVNVGQELLCRATNNTGITITNGQVVTSDGINMVLADASDYALSRTICVATHDIENGTAGYATAFGDVGDLNTSAYSVGDILYLSAATPGALTTTKPADANFAIQVGIVRVSSATVGVIRVNPIISELTVEVTDTNGFTPAQVTNTTITKVDGTRTFTITPTAATFDFYERGEKYEITGADSIVWTDVEGEHWFYYMDGVLTATANPSIALRTSIILNNAFISSLYWNATDKETVVDILEERHGISMSPQTHLYLHLTRGAQFYEGLATGDILADENGSLDTHAQFSVGSGVYFDEDITHTPAAIAVGDTIPVVYNEGAGVLMRADTQTNFGVLNAPAGRLYYNQNNGGTWQLTECSDNSYVLYHVFAFNGVTTGTITVMGQNEYSSTSNARAGASTEITALLNQLPIAEMVPLSTVIYQTRNSYSNSVQARIRTTDTGETHIDWRTSELAQGVAASSHNNLTDLQLAQSGVTWGHIDDQAQTIAGVKTFSASPIVPAPTTDLQAATKKYVDDNSGGGGGGLDLYFGGQEGELVVGSISRRFVSGTATASAFYVTLEVAGTGTNGGVIKLYKNGVEEASCTFTTGQAAAANGLVVVEDATLVSGSYVKGDLLEVKCTDEGDTTPGISLQWAIVV